MRGTCAEPGGQAGQRRDDVITGQWQYNTPTAGTLDLYAELDALSTPALAAQVRALALVPDDLSEVATPRLLMAQAILRDRTRASHHPQAVVSRRAGLAVRPW